MVEEKEDSLTEFEMRNGQMDKLGAMGGWWVTGEIEWKLGLAGPVKEGECCGWKTNIYTISFPPPKCQLGGVR